MLNTNKRLYEAPLLSVSKVEIEHSIAAGSATVTPINPNQQVMESWEEDPTESHTIVW